MMYFSPGSHLFRLVTVLSLVGEYPTTSLQLLGDRQELGRLVQKLTQPQVIRNSATGEKLCVKVINLSGKSPCTTIRLSRFALPLLDWIGTREYYESRFTRSGMSSSKTHHERSYRVAETAVMLLRAGIECRPWMLPALQMQRRALIIDRPMALLARDVKQIEPESVNKTKYARYTGALFTPASCMAVYNTRNAVMRWNGEGEFKARQDLIQIARNNSGCSQLDTAVLLGQDYSVALDTIRCKDTWKGKPQRFDSIYPHVCFVPLQDFGVRQLAIMRLPDWREQILDLLFDEDTRSDNKGAFEYDALEDNTYLFSFLDGDIARLIRFHDAMRNTKLNCKVIAYPEQISFLQSCLPDSVEYYDIPIDQIEQELEVKARSLLDG